EVMMMPNLDARRNPETTGTLRGRELSTLPTLKRSIIGFVIDPSSVEEEATNKTGACHRRSQDGQHRRRCEVRIRAFPATLKRPFGGVANGPSSVEEGEAKRETGQ